MTLICFTKFDIGKLNYLSENRSHKTIYFGEIGLKVKILDTI